MIDYPPRDATLILVGSDGRRRGSVGPIRLTEPWWNETASVVERLPGAVVLRLLAAPPDRPDGCGGAVTYLIQHDGTIPYSLGPLVPLPDRPPVDPLGPHPLRMPWARLGGPAADLAWVKGQVAVDPTRPAVQHRSWNLSTVWSIPVLDQADGDAPGSNDTVWLKCVPPFFAHERAVLEILSDQPVPRLIAAAGHRLLLAAMPGSDGFGPSPDEQRAMVDSLVDIQLASSERTTELLSAGVPDLRLEPLMSTLSAFVGRIAPDDELLTAFVQSLPSRLEPLAALELPDVLNHGDPHGGNCRRGTDPALWFDWGDSFIGNPLLDVASGHWMSDQTVSHWLGRWADHIGWQAVSELWPRLKPVAMLNMARVYRRFCDNIEPDERIYHAADVDRSLDAVRRFLSDQPAAAV